jgi:AcrR family transcriptional regulator
MGIREERKRETRRVILESTKQLLLENGFVKVSTKEISKKAGVAQGSIFLHFSDKESLLNEIISTDIKKLHDELQNEVDSKSVRETFLGELIEVLSNNEDILSRVYKDYDYLSDKLQKNVDMIENLLKNMIFDNLRVSPGKVLSIVDSFILIDAFYSQIKANLLDKEVYSGLNSILRNRRGKLSKLYRILFE